MEKFVQDAVHGMIKLEDWMVAIIDTPQFQRLRRIKQLGFANLVYPGANHTRFEHSLGVAHLAAKLKERLELDEEVVAAALLHDVGHAPFSHGSERLLERFARIRHEDLRSVVRGELRDVVKELGFNLSRLSDIVSGKVPSIVSGDVDVDRMDYLVRDSHYTGVAYGVIDLNRLISKIKFEDGVVIEEGGIKAAESLLISRFLMYPTVYFHHVCRIARKMYEKAMERIIERGFDAKKLLDMDDCSAMMLMKEEEPEFYEMLANRKLFKRALYVGKDAIDLREVLKIKEERAEREIAETAGVDEKYVIVDIPPMEEVREVSVKVSFDGKLMRLDEVSSLVKALKSAWTEMWRLGVYTKREYVEKVEKAARDYFGVERVVQKSLDLF
ncbi:MAG: HD domain-containing protein [Archaeoglobaceae archaeon]